MVVIAQKLGVHAQKLGMGIEHSPEAMFNFTSNGDEPLRTRLPAASLLFFYSYYKSWVFGG